MQTKYIFTGMSNANMYTSCGNFITAITYDKKTKKGNVVFEKDIDYNGFWNFCISYKNEYNHCIYIRLTAPELLTKDKSIKGQVSYGFTFSQLWIKTFDEDDNQISFDSYF